MFFIALVAQSEKALVLRKTGTRASDSLCSGPYAEENSKSKNPIPESMDSTTFIHSW